MKVKKDIMKAGIAVSIAVSTTLLAAPSFAATITTEGVPQYNHQFVIMMENHDYQGEIIGNPNAPYINSLANTDNLATNYYGSTHPSLPNYLHTISGSDFGNGAVADAAFPNPLIFPDPNGGNDNPPCSSIGTTGAPAGTACDPTITSPSIVDQLGAKGLTWKSYQQNLPAVGSLAANSSDSSGQNDKLYAVKHNPFAYFSTVQTGTDPVTGKPELNNMVPLDDPSVGLVADLNNGTVPNFSFIAPNQCNDMHGDTAASSPCASISQNPATDPTLIKQGDNYVKSLVSEITGSKTWSQGNNAIYLLWDENDYAPTTPNQVPLITITNNGPKGIQDNTFYNHDSLLRTIDDGFGITTYLNGAATATPLAPLLTGVGATPVPEPTSTMGLLVFGAMGTGLLLKRKLKK